jgi:hypothetical protein
MVLTGEADGDANGEHKSEMSEDRRAAGGDERNVEKIGLPEAQKQAGDRQDCDRQHEGAPKLL